MSRNVCNVKYVCISDCCETSVVPSRTTMGPCSVKYSAVPLVGREREGERERGRERERERESKSCLDAARAVWMREKGKRNATACERGWSLVSEVAVSVLEPGVAKTSSSVAIAASSSHLCRY